MATKSTTSSEKYEKCLRNDALHVIDSFAFIDNPKPSLDLSESKVRRAVGIWFEDVTGKPRQGWDGKDKDQYLTKRVR